MTADTTQAAVAAALMQAAGAVAKRRDDYQCFFGVYDATTGVTEYPGNGSEWVEEWEEIEAAILALIPADAMAALEAVKSEARREAGADLARLQLVRDALFEWLNVLRNGRTIDPSITGLGDMIRALDAAMRAKP
jgi:hypothetical protein